MRERLLDQVWARLERFEADQDPAAVLGQEAVGEVTALLESVTGPAADLEVAYAAGWLHWYRYLVLASGDGHQDLATAFALDTAVDLFQQALACVPASHPVSVTMLSTLGLALRTRFRRTGNVADLDAAVSAGRAAVEASPPGHPDRAKHMAVLDATLAACASGYTT